MAKYTAGEIFQFEISLSLETSNTTTMMIPIKRAPTIARNAVQGNLFQNPVRHGAAGASG
jgi:hypothetical protein